MPQEQAELQRTGIHQISYSLPLCYMDREEAAIVGDHTSQAIEAQLARGIMERINDGRSYTVRVFSWSHTPPADLGMWPPKSGTTKRAVILLLANKAEALVGDYVCWEELERYVPERHAGLLPCGVLHTTDGKAWEVTKFWIPERDCRILCWKRVA